MRRVLSAGCGSVIVLAAALAVGDASAQIGAQSTRTTPEAAVRAYWTAERLQTAEPVDAAVSVDLDTPPAAQVRPAARVQSEPGAPPSEDVAPVEHRLFAPEKPGGTAGEADASEAGAMSSWAYFTTSRVFPSGVVTTYPWRATGKLFFHDPRTGDNFFCSAAVVRPRLVVTAGQCVYHASASASSRYFFDNFLFVPAYDRGNAPFGAWTASYVITSDAWSSSDGTHPNEQDVALMEIVDQEVGGSPNKIGDVTGYLGYATNSLHPQSVTAIGYAENLDQGERLEVNWAQTYGAPPSIEAKNTILIGSAMQAGSLGGPWIKDFGISPSGLPAGNRNQLVSVASYGSPDIEQFYQGGSMLDDRFISILNRACAHKAGNC